MKNRVLAIGLAILTMLSLLPIEAMAVGKSANLSVTALQDGEKTPAVINSGACGDDLTWTFYNNGELVICGSGEMYNYTSSSAYPWYGYQMSVKSVTIDSDGIFLLLNGIFSDYYCLTSVTISGSAIGIGENAFINCISLMDVALSGELIQILPGAFANTPWMEAQGDFMIENGCLIHYWGTSAEVTIPDTVTSIGGGAFALCENLTAVVIPDSVTSIGMGAFSCINLTDVTLPSGAVDMDGSAFLGTPWLETQLDRQSDFVIFNGSLIRYQGMDTDVTIPDTVTSICPEAFVSCNNLTSVVIPDSVTSIGMEAFANCNNLTSVTLSDNITRIENYTFMDCAKLSDITIPDSVTYIGNSAFRGCGQLKSITIPDGVTEIEGDTFRGCSQLESVTLPDSVTRIGGYAFYQCSNLKNIMIPSRVTEIGQFAFAYSDIGEAYCNVCNLTIPDSVKSIGDSAFYACPLDHVIFGRGIETIGKNAFSPNSNSPMCYMIFMGDAPTLGENAFAYIDESCPIYYPAGNATYTRQMRQSYGGDVEWIPLKGMDNTSGKDAEAVLEKYPEFTIYEESYWEYYHQNAITVGKIMRGHDLEEKVLWRGSGSYTETKMWDYEADGWLDETITYQGNTYYYAGEASDGFIPYSVIGDMIFIYSDILRVTEDEDLEVIGGAATGRVYQHEPDTTPQQGGHIARLLSLIKAVISLISRIIKLLSPLSRLGI